MRSSHRKKCSAGPPYPSEYEPVDTVFSWEGVNDLRQEPVDIDHPLWDWCDVGCADITRILEDAKDLRRGDIIAYDANGPWFTVFRQK